MNPELKQEWLQALRSEKFEQGQGALKRTLSENKFSYCCLGVLGEICVQKGLAAWHEVRDGSDVTQYLVAVDKDGRIIGNGSGGFLPAALADVVGLNSISGRLPIMADVEFQALSDLNDLAELNFKQIADLIEKYL